ncbi:GNAT family protein [Nocardioides sp. GY 10127]|uniref:GNAT family N-acetyltransferase n=1 Tax=Nocardioides sp. GY 10127 TaxID=2569762 RepID=UPI0010A7CF90|nr:GNAT family protein [Nocardioides sp. GY 10127]TIC85680.1 GNAT family N-acetyltransferase [Nocardioides sp. GY 10127]
MSSSIRAHLRASLDPEGRDEARTDGLPAGYRLRRLRMEDAGAVAEARLRNRAHLEPWEPQASVDLTSTVGVQRLFAAAEARERAGEEETWYLWCHEVQQDGAERPTVVGHVSLGAITRGGLQSARLGYWVDAAHTRRGLATAMVTFAGTRALELGLHRIEAGTRTDNVASAGVLQRSGFERVGVLRQMLFIHGAWRDHDLWQRVLGDAPPAGDSERPVQR